MEATPRAGIDAPICGAKDRDQYVCMCARLHDGPHTAYSFDEVCRVWLAGGGEEW